MTAYFHLMFEYLKLWRRAWIYRLTEDAAEIQLLRKRIRKGDTAFDIGAHKGSYTWWMRKCTGTSGMIVAFEPQPAGAALLRRLFKSPPVRIEQLALSGMTGKQDLFILPQGIPVSFEASLQNNYEGSEMVEVETDTLDHYCERNGLRPSFIKIDVEGHEKSVIEGGINYLQKNKPVLLMEAEIRHSGPEAISQLFAILKGIGYQGYFFYDGKRIPIEQFEPALHQDLSNLQHHKQHYSNNFVFEPAT